MDKNDKLTPSYDGSVTPIQVFGGTNKEGFNLFIKILLFICLILVVVSIIIIIIESTNQTNFLNNNTYPSKN